MSDFLSFRLPDSAVNDLIATLPDPWTGYTENILGHIVFLTRYSRRKADGTKETWGEVVRRCVEGSYSIQRDWCISQRIPWSDEKATLSALEMFDRMYTFKFTPPGRGLWMMGTEFVHARLGSAALQNCAFVSTGQDLIAAATFLMEASMLGVGVGFDVAAAGHYSIVRTSQKAVDYLYEISDDREGWVGSVNALLKFYLNGGYHPVFDYSKIRPAGEPINGFGGVAAGPAPLGQLHNSIEKLFDNRDGEKITERDVTDLMNLIGVCVVAGNVRRSAEVALGPPSEDFLNLKNYDILGVARHPIAEGRAEHGWASNNSIVAQVGATDYRPIAKLIEQNGEPGIFWLDLSQQYGRLGDVRNDADYRAKGSNPCLEQTLESYEMCNLVETYPSNHDSREDFLRTLKFAYLYAKSVTLLPTHWQETNAIMLRNRRIGCSITGAFQFAEEYGLPELLRWCDSGYAEIKKWDDIYSEWLCIRPSIKTTSIKPSGTVSKMVVSKFRGKWYSGITPGVHSPVERSWLQRIILDPNDPMTRALEIAKYETEPSAYSKSSIVVEIPVFGPPVRTQKRVSMWEKASLAAAMQRVWADNAVSVTITFDRDFEGPQIAHLIHAYEGQLKAVSFLPIQTDEQSDYRQLPMESRPEDSLQSYAASLRPVNFAGVYAGGKDASGEKYCDTDVCELPKV